MARKILGILVGLVIGFLVTAALQAISSLLYPMPANLELSDPVAFAGWIRSLPIGAFVIVLASHILGAFTAAFVCQYLVPTRWRLGTLLIGSLLFLAGVVNLVAIPHPPWFAVADLIAYFPAAYFGAFLGEKLSMRKATADSDS